MPKGGVVSNPTLISGTVPGVAATNSGKITGFPMTTPPETPSSTGTGSKRDATDNEKEEGKEPKKRRIAPTPVESKGL